MARIEEFDFRLVQHVQQEINDVLKQIGEAHGINIELQRMKYDKFGFKGYIEGQTVTEDSQGGNGIDWQKKYRDEFLRNCKLFGFEEKHLGQPVHLESGIYKLIGFQPRAKKYKVICENGKGRAFRFHVNIIKKALGLV